MCGSSATRCWRSGLRICPPWDFRLAVAYFALHTLPEWVSVRRPARVLVPVFGVAMVIFTWPDLRAVPRWRDNDTLWNYSYQVAPQSALVHVHRALDLQFRENDPAGAIREYDLAIQLARGSSLQLATVTYSACLGSARSLTRGGAPKRR